MGGPNHVSNRVLSCATCNEAEKLDRVWEEFMVRKNPEPAILQGRVAKIHEWQQLNKKPTVDREKVREIESLSNSVVAFYEDKVRAARRINRL
jgi:hypothetical protein